MKASLKTKATVLVATTIIGVFGALGYWRHEHLADDFVEVQSQQQSALAQMVADDLADKLETHLRLLERSAELLDAGVFGDRDRRAAWLQRVSAARTLFDGLALVSLDGDVLEHEPLIAGGGSVNVRDRDYFRQVIGGAGAAISEPVQSRSGFGAALIMAAPIRGADGRIVAVLAGGLQLERANMLGRLAQASVGRSGHFEVVTAGAAPVYVVHRDRSRLLTPAPAWAAAADSDPRAIVTRVSIRRVGWELRAILPGEEAFAPVARARARLWAILGALAAGCCAITWVGMSWVLHPLAKLRASMRALRESPDGGCVRLDVAAPDERGELAREFESLLHELRAQQAELSAVVDASPLGFFRSDEAGYTTYVNDTYLRLHGLTRDQASDGWLQLVHADARAAAWQHWQAAVKRDEPFALVREVVRPDGVARLLSVRTAPLKFDGRVQGHVGTVSDITERAEADRAMRAAQQALRDSERRLRMVTDHLPVLISYLDRELRFRFVNETYREWFGIDPQQQLGLSLQEFYGARTFDAIAPSMNAALGGEQVSYERTIEAAGQVRDVRVTVVPDRNQAGHVDGLYTLIADITSYRSDQRALQRQAATLRSVTEAIPAIVAVIGADQRYRLVNSAFERWYGAQRESIVGHTLAEVLGRREAERSRPWVERALAGESVTFEKRYEERRSERHLAISYIPLWLEDGNGSVDGFVAVAQDITHHREEENRLLDLAHRDVLTGLLNRAGFETFLERCLAHSDVTKLALLYIDLDNFKPVNDEHGHLTGDRVLQQFATRLLGTVRPTDGVARLGGDEFAVVLLDVPDAGIVQTIADKIVALARTPFAIDDGRQVNIGASIGIASGIKPGTGLNDFIAQADTMLYQAKRAGRGQHAGVLH